MLARGGVVPGIFKIRTLLLHGFLIDVLHAIDQGVACRLIGDVFVKILELKREWGSTQKERVAALQVGSIIPELCKCNAMPTANAIPFALPLLLKPNAG